MRHALAAALLLLAAPAGAGTIVLDFEEETVGNLGPSFLSVECGCVTISETRQPTSAQSPTVGDYGTQSHGKALEVGEAARARRLRARGACDRTADPARPARDRAALGSGP
jgi:hypothetical protein